MATIGRIVSSNLGVPACDVCAHEWKCPNPTVHELTGYCPDCEIWPEILEEHILECAARCTARLQMCSRDTWGRAKQQMICPYEDGLNIARHWIMESCVEAAESLYAWRTAERVILRKSHYCFMDLYSHCPFCEELAEHAEIIRESLQFYRAELRDFCEFTRVCEHINAASQRSIRGAWRTWTSEALAGST